MKENKSENLLWIIFTIIGGIFVVIGLIIVGNVFNYENKESTVGIITEISTYRGNNDDRNYRVYVSYNVDGRTYESELNGYSSSFYEGKKINIYYDKNKYDGYFFRDGNLVVIYGIDASENFLDKTWIKKDNRGIPNFKYRTIDEWNYPYPLKLEIFSNGNVKELSLSEGFAI